MCFEGKYQIINNVADSEMDGYFSLLESRISSDFPAVFLKLGEDIVKVQSNFPVLIDQLTKHCAYIVVKNTELPYKTIYFWKDNIRTLLAANVQNVDCLAINPKNNNGSYLKILQVTSNSVEAYNAKTSTIYMMYAHNVELDINVIRKMGHIIVRYLYEISKSENQILTHSASVGLNNKGVMISARGGGGKSTLAVSAMLDGFQYVSDDYLMLTKKNDGLFACPVYSTINLSPSIIEKMPALKAGYLWNSWWQPQKHTLEISEHHSSFVNTLPIKALIFPQIKDIETPQIEKMTDKGKAITQMVYSSVSQLVNPENRSDYIKTLLSFIKDLNVYKINLSPDLKKNTKCLRKFIENL